MASPRLSVIVASYNAIDTIEFCLAALESQDCDEPFEVIVVDSSTDDTAEVVRRRFPRVRLHAFEERKYPGHARNLGVERCESEILAFTDSDCIPDRGWVRATLAAHRRPDPVIGGVIDNANPESYIGWAYYFCELSKWMPGTPEGPMVDIPTGNLSIKRWAFEEHGQFLEGTYSSDTGFNWRVGDRGRPPYFDPAMEVAHVNVTDLGDYLRRKVFHGQCFARVRVAERGFSTARRLAYAGISLGLPVLLAARTVRDVVTRGRYLDRLVLSFPLVVLGLAAWSLGELRGYLGLDP